MSPLPTSVRIGPFTYSIEAWDNEEARAEKNWGLCLRDQMRILIDEELVGQRRLEVVVHEIFHALWDAAGLDDGPDEERAVTGLALGFIAFMRDNPKLIRWLCKECKQ